MLLPYAASMGRVTARIYLPVHACFVFCANALLTLRKYVCVLLHYCECDIAHNLFIFSRSRLCIMAVSLS